MKHFMLAFQSCPQLWESGRGYERNWRQHIGDLLGLLTNHLDKLVPMNLEGMREHWENLFSHIRNLRASDCLGANVWINMYDWLWFCLFGLSYSVLMRTGLSVASKFLWRLIQSSAYKPSKSYRRAYWALPTSWGPHCGGSPAWNRAVETLFFSAHSRRRPSQASHRCDNRTLPDSSCHFSPWGE